MPAALNSSPKFVATPAFCKDVLSAVNGFLMSLNRDYQMGDQAQEINRPTAAGLAETQRMGTAPGNRLLVSY